jgi:hypothetical protein
VIDFDYQRKMFAQLALSLDLPAKEQRSACCQAGADADEPKSGSWF